MELFSIPMGIQSKVAQSPKGARQRLVNGYAVPMEGKSPIVVYRTPGVKEWATIGSGSLIRGADYMNGILYVVAGTRLYKVNSDGTTQDKGFIPGSGRVSMANDGYSLVITNNVNDAYYYQGASVYKVDDPDFPSASMVAWLDGYFIYQPPSSGRFYVTAVADPNDIDALDYATAESAPDDTLSILVSNGALYLFGTDSVEVWGIRSGGTFPFIRHANGRMEVGCAAKWSPAKDENTVFWLADDRTCRAFGSAAPVSTREIEGIWAEYADVSDAIGYVSNVAGRKTYTLTFPSAEASWQFDISTGLWNELESYGKGRCRVDGYIKAYGKHLVWDAYANRLGELDENTYAEWGETLVWTSANPVMTQGLEPIFHDAYLLDIETGVGTLTDNAEVMLKWTDDGYTWSDEYWRDLGLQGKRRERIAWHQLGRSDGRTYEVSVSDPVFIAAYSAQLDIEDGYI